jgi:outer membrane protein
MTVSLKRIIILGCLLAPLALAAEEITVERILDLDKSIFYAQRNRKEILLAQRDIDLAKERVNEALSFRFPKIDFMFNYVKIDDNKTTVLSPYFGSIYIPENFPATPYLEQYLTRLSLWWNLYSGGRYTSSLKLAESNLAKATHQLNIAENKVNFEVKKEFYGLLALEEKIKTYEKILPDLEKYGLSAEELQKKNIDKGRISSGRMVTKIRNEYLLLKNNIYPKGRMDFLDTLGLELDVVFMLNGEFKPVNENFTLGELLALAFKYRIEPRQIQVEEEMDALSIKLSMSARYPTITLGVNYDYANDSLSDMFSRKVANTALNFNLPIFDGWASWARIGQKRIQVDQDKLQRKGIEDSIRLEVREAYNDYEFWTQELPVREAETKKYEDMLNTLDIKDISARVEAYYSYLESRMSYIDCVCNNLVSYTALEHAVGKPLKTD